MALRLFDSGRLLTLEFLLTPLSSGSLTLWIARGISHGAHRQRARAQLRDLARRGLRRFRDSDLTYDITPVTPRIGRRMCSRPGVEAYLDETRSRRLRRAH